MSKITNALNKAMEERGSMQAPQEPGVRLGNVDPGPWKWVALVAGVLILIGGMVWWESAKTERRARAMYDEGIDLLEAGRDREGQAQLLHFVETHPLSDWADDALWAISRSQLIVGDRDGAHHTQQRLMATYPESPWIQEMAKKPSLATEVLESETTAPAMKPAREVAETPQTPEPTVTAAEPEPPAQPKSPIRYYEVKKGDTLSKIAKQFNTTVEKLRETNGIKGDLIRVKQKLKIASN